MPAAFVFARRYDEAIRVGRREVERFPDYGWNYEFLAIAYELSGMYQQGLVAEQQAIRLMGPGVERKPILARAYAGMGQRDAASRILAELLQLRHTTYVAPVQFAYVYIALGQRDEAVEWLKRGYEVRDAEMPFLKTYAVFDPLRDDPRFQDLLRRMNFPPN